MGSGRTKLRGGGLKFRQMGPMEKSIDEEIHLLYETQSNLEENPDNYDNWELSYNRIELMISKLYKQRDIAKILES